MEQKELIEVDLKLVEDFNMVRHNEYRFITSDFGFVNSFIKMESRFLTLGQPYRIKDSRIIFLRQGSARVLVNLIEHRFNPDNLLLVTSNSIVQIIETSPDFDMQLIGIDNDFLPITGKEEFFTHFLQRQKNILLMPTPQESQRIKDYFSLMWDILQETPFQREAIQHLLTSLLYNISYIAKNTSQPDCSQTHQEDIFQRFISLVNTYSKKERNVNFYADKLCLTPRYLNTVIRQTSQQTVMDWINQSIILEAKVLLKHSNQLVYQISDELNFPNPSFFCKFFKRMTGMTPQEYQKSK